MGAYSSENYTKCVSRLCGDLSGSYARVVDHLAVRNVAQGAALGGRSTLHTKN